MPTRARRDEREGEVVIFPLLSSSAGAIIQGKVMHPRASDRGKFLSQTKKKAKTAPWCVKARTVLILHVSSPDPRFPRVKRGKKGNTLLHATGHFSSYSSCPPFWGEKYPVILSFSPSSLEVSLNSGFNCGCLTHDGGGRGKTRFLWAWESRSPAAR